MHDCQYVWHCHHHTKGYAGDGSHEGHVAVEGEHQNGHRGHNQLQIRGEARTVSERTNRQHGSRTEGKQQQSLALQDDLKLRYKRSLTHRLMKAYGFEY